MAIYPFFIYQNCHSEGFNPKNLPIEKLTAVIPKQQILRFTQDDIMAPRIGGSGAKPLTMLTPWGKVLSSWLSAINGIVDGQSPPFSLCRQSAFGSFSLFFAVKKKENERTDLRRSSLL